MPSSRSRWGRILFPVLFSLASVSEGSAQPARTEGWVFGLGSGTTAVYVNTLMIQQVLSEAGWFTPLIHSHVNPYGSFELDMKKRLSLDQPVAV